MEDICNERGGKPQGGDHGGLMVLGVQRKSETEAATCIYLVTAPAAIILIIISNIKQIVPATKSSIHLHKM